MNYYIIKYEKYHNDRILPSNVLIAGHSMADAFEGWYQTHLKEQDAIFRISEFRKIGENEIPLTDDDADRLSGSFYKM